MGLYFRSVSTQEEDKNKEEKKNPLVRGKNKNVQTSQIIFIRKMIKVEMIESNSKYALFYTTLWEIEMNKNG